MRSFNALTISLLEVYERAIAAHLGVWDVEGLEVGVVVAAPMRTRLWKCLQCFCVWRTHS